MLNENLPPTLLERTQALLASAPRSLKAKDIAQGSGVSGAWLSRFSRGMIPDPGVQSVQKLHDYLVGLNG